VHLSLQLCGRHNEEDRSPDQFEQKHKILFQKIRKAKGAGDVAQVVEHLPSKRKGLSLTLSMAKKRDREMGQNPTSESMTVKVFASIYICGRTVAFVGVCTVFLTAL
jgi:hypothetical protein